MKSISLTIMDGCTENLGKARACFTRLHALTLGMVVADSDGGKSVEGGLRRALQGERTSHSPFLRTRV
jgi:hypothetical protein